MKVQYVFFEVFCLQCATSRDGSRSGMGNPLEEVLC